MTKHLQLLALAAAAALLGCQRSSVKIDVHPLDGGYQSKQEVINYLAPALKRARRGVRVYYSSNCSPHKDLIPFPVVNMKRPVSGELSLATVRDLFARDRRVAVSEDESSGVIRIQIGNVPNAILGTTLHVQTFGQLAQYNEQLAIGAIENNSEVAAANRALGLRTPRKTLDLLLVQPAPELVHLPGTLHNTTMDRALDVVATTFRGIVFYGICMNRRLYDVTLGGGVYYEPV